MPSLQVRDLPESLYEELRRCAVEQDRSISQQTVHLLRASLEAYRLRQENLGQMLAHDEGVALIIQFLTMRSPHEDDQVAARIKRRKETFACIDKAPLPSVGEFADPAAVIRAMRDERDAAYPELLTGAKQREDA